MKNIELLKLFKNESYIEDLNKIISKFFHGQLFKYNLLKNLNLTVSATNKNIQFSEIYLEKIEVKDFKYRYIILSNDPQLINLNFIKYNECYLYFCNEINHVGNLMVLK